MIDSVSRDVFQHEVVSVAEEMSAALRRSAFSAIIWDMIDYACGLLDPEGNTIAQAPTIPAQLGIMPTAFRHMIRAIHDEQQFHLAAVHALFRLFDAVAGGGDERGQAAEIGHHVERRIIEIDAVRQHTGGTQQAGGFVEIAGRQTGKGHGGFLVTVPKGYPRSCEWMGAS